MKLVPCKNPLCDRKTNGALYCCFPCSVAHDNGYEIHEKGDLGHSKDCNDRREARSTERNPNG